MIPDQAIKEHSFKWLRRLLRCRFVDGNNWRCRWGELVWRFGFSAELCLFEEGYSLKIHLVWPLLFISLKWLPSRAPKEMMESWGFDFHERSIHLNWGHRCKILHFPWEFRRVRNEVLREDGSWGPFVGSWEHDKEADGRAIEEHPYRYVLRDGTVQNRIATIHVEESEYRWRSAKWLPWPRKIYRCIEVEFDGEVGEKSGSWKGGCVGCSYEMKPDETPAECLKRMERERKF